MDHKLNRPQNSQFVFICDFFVQIMSAYLKIDDYTKTKRAKKSNDNNNNNNKLKENPTTHATNQPTK